MRSLLFVPGHDARKFAKGLDCGADALILDLEDSVPDTEKSRARGVSAEFVAEHRERLRLFVRAQPYGVVLPKCESGSDVARVDAYISALETREGVAAGSLRILPIVTESAAALFAMGSYALDAGPRLCG